MNYFFICSILLSLVLSVCYANDREKRYIFVNPDAPITLGFILNMPISLALPTIANKGRSLDLMNKFDKESEFPEDFYIDPNYEEELGRLQVYFSHLEIPTLGCQERLLCEVSAEPDKYSPMSDMVLKELRQRRGELKESSASLMWRYLVASREGFLVSSDKCQETYKNCPVTTSSMLNIPVLRVWQFISSRLNLQLV